MSTMETETANPMTVAIPASLPPCLKDSGIMVLLSIMRMDPPAKALYYNDSSEWIITLFKKFVHIVTLTCNLHNQVVLSEHDYPKHFRRTHPVRRGIPCLLCIHEWRHWVAVVKEERGRFILLDSEERAVLTIVSSEELSRLWAYHPRDEARRNGNGTVYDLHPLVPRFRVRLRGRFSISRARFLRRPENRELARRVGRIP
jgi:hypothetical protein